MIDVQLPKQSVEDADYIANWPMPPVEVGEMIVWMPDYAKPHVKSAGFVTEVNFRSISCRAADGAQDASRFDVLHVGDPRLAVNQFMRRNGAWDYGPMAARLRKIEAAQTAMNELLVELLGEEAEQVVFVPAKEADKEPELLNPEEIERRKSIGEKVRAAHAKRREAKRVREERSAKRKAQLAEARENSQTHQENTELQTA